MRDYDFSQLSEETIQEVAKKFDLQDWEAIVKLQITAEIHDWSLAQAAEHLLHPNVRY